jgi:hypothetical protein
LDCVLPTNSRGDCSSSEPPASTSRAPSAVPPTSHASTPASQRSPRSTMHDELEHRARSGTADTHGMDNLRVGHCQLGQACNWNNLFVMCTSFRKSAHITRFDEFTRIACDYKQQSSTQSGSRDRRRQVEKCCSGECRLHKDRRCWKQTYNCTA